MSWKRWPIVTALRRLKARTHIPVLRRRTHDGRILNFYVLSTGRTGTRFLSRVLGTATNAAVHHQPSPQLKDTVVREVVGTWAASREAFWDLRVEDFPLLEEKILGQLAIPAPIYGDTLNHMFPFGHMLYRYLGRERIRLIHLVRHPVPCCRSILVAEKDFGEGGRFGELRPPEFLEGETAAEKAAGVWNGVNEMAARQLERIDDPGVCRTVRIEDVDVELARELFDFLGLEGFDRDELAPLMRDDSREVRHSHVEHHADRRVEREELETVARLCRSRAEGFGYDVDPDRIPDEG